MEIVLVSVEIAGRSYRAREREDTLLDSTCTVCGCQLVQIFSLEDKRGGREEKEGIKSEGEREGIT